MSFPVRFLILLVTLRRKAKRREQSERPQAGIKPATAACRQAQSVGAYNPGNPEGLRIVQSPPGDRRPVRDHADSPLASPPTSPPRSDFLRLESSYRPGNHFLGLHRLFPAGANPPDTIVLSASSSILTHLQPSTQIRPTTSRLLAALIPSRRPSMPPTTTPARIQPLT
jgi:hypothetical protein